MPGRNRFDGHCYLLLSGASSSISTGEYVINSKIIKSDDSSGIWKITPGWRAERGHSIQFYRFLVNYTWTKWAKLPLEWLQTISIITYTNGIWRCESDYKAFDVNCDHQHSEAVERASGSEIKWKVKSENWKSHKFEIHFKLSSRISSVDRHLNRPQTEWAIPIKCFMDRKPFESDR